MSNDQTTKTALDLITGALRKIGQYAPGEAISGSDADDALDCLNGMLDLWSLQELAVYNQIETVKSLIPGQLSYSIGAGGDFNIERPYRIATAFSRLTTSNSNVDFPCDVITLERYSAIGLKNMPGPWPKAVYFNSGWPLGTLNFWPVPTGAAEFHLWTDQVFTSLALADPVNLPRGYFLGVQANLCEVLAPEYGVSLSPELKKMAQTFMSILKDNNATPQNAAPLDAAVVATSGNDAGWILHGGFN
jgi:hypothetical protein